MGMVMHVMGVAAFCHVATIVVMVMLDAARRLAGERHVAAVVIGGIDAALSPVRLAAMFRAALAFEATATAAAAPAPATATCAAFRIAVTMLAGLDLAVLLQRDLLMHGLFADGLRFHRGRCHGNRRHRRRDRCRWLAAGRLRLRTAFLALAAFTTLAARTTVAAITTLAVMSFLAA